MTPEEVLLKTKGWVRTKIEESKRPYADKFTLTSVGYCLGQAVGMMENWEAFEAAFALVREVTLAQGSPVHAVFSPEEILNLIEEALVLCK